MDSIRGDLVYVGDQENHPLQVFEKDGTFVRAWGDERFQHIHDVGIDPASGEIFVGDLEYDTVRKFTPTGELIATFGDPSRDGPRLVLSAFPPDAGRPSTVSVRADDDAAAGHAVSALMSELRADPGERWEREPS